MRWQKFMTIAIRFQLLLLFPLLSWRRPYQRSISVFMKESVVIILRKYAVSKMEKMRSYYKTVLNVTYVNTKIKN